MTTKKKAHKQYTAEVVLKMNENKTNKWTNAYWDYTNGKKKFAPTLEEAKKAIKYCENKFKGKAGKTETEYIGSIGVSTTIDKRTEEALSVVKSRIRVREVTDWEEV